MNTNIHSRGIIGQRRIGNQQSVRYMSTHEIVPRIFDYFILFKKENKKRRDINSRKREKWASVTNAQTYSSL